MIILIALATFVATLLGGLLALKFSDKLHLILGFTAGAVIGVAFFDLLPEAQMLGARFYDPAYIMIFTAAGFLGYLLLDRLLLLHSHPEGELHHHHDLRRGLLGAGTLSLHSFLDGVVIGLAFQVAPAVGFIVAIAVLAHDFSDGINTVNFLVKHSHTNKIAFRWLLIDAIAPVLGVLSTFLFRLPESALGLVLAVFAGFFFYIGASDLIPESHHSHPKILTTLMTLLGAGVIFAVVRLAG